MRNVGNKIILFLSLYGLLSFHLFEMSSLKMQFGGGVIFSSARAEGPEANVNRQTHDMDKGNIEGETYISLITLLVGTLIAYSMPFGCGNTCGPDVWVSVAAATVFLAGEITAYIGYRRALHYLKTSVTAKCDYRNPEHNGKIKTTVVRGDNGLLEAKKEAGEAGKNACNDSNNTQFEILRKQRESYAQIRDVATAKAVLQGAAAVGWGAAAVMAFFFSGETAGLAPSVATPASVIAGTLIAQAVSTSLGTLVANGSAATALLPLWQADMQATIVSFLMTPTPVDSGSTFVHCSNLSALIGSKTAAWAGKCGGLIPTCAAPLTAAGASLSASVMSPQFCSLENTAAVMNAGPVGMIIDYHDRKNPSLNNDAQYLVQNFIKALFIKDVQAQENKEEETAGSVGHDIAFWTAITGGPAALIFWGSKNKMAKLWSGMFVKPVTRGLFYTALFGLATTATILSATVAAKMQENCKAIDDILKDSGADSANVTLDGGDVTTVPLALIANANATGPVNLGPGDSVPCPAGKDKNGNCMTPPNLDDPRFGFGKLPGDIRSTAQTMASLARSIGGKKAISRADLKMAAGLSKNAAGMRKRLQEAKNKLNSMLPKNHNLDGVLNNMMAATRAATLKSLKDNNKTPVQALAALGGVQAFPDDLKKSIEADFQKADKKSLLDSAGAAVNPETPNFNFDLGNKEAAPAAVVDSAAGDAAIEGLDIKVDDIASNKENIFEMISVRYKKTAYPKLFTELPPQKEAEKTPPKQ